MKDLSLTLSTPFTTKRASVSTSVNKINIVMIALILGFGLTYLFLVNNLGTKGYEIRKLELQLRKLEDEQKQLQIQASDLTSIEKLQSEAQKLNYIPATGVTYLKESDFAYK